MYAPNLTDAALAAAVRALAVEVATQDHRATSFCCFIVQEKVEIMGANPDYHGDLELHYIEDQERVHPADKAEELRWSEGDYGDRDIEAVNVLEYWQNVAMCFTQKGADEYIAEHKHNLGETRVYCSSGHRNHEWQLLTEFLERYGKTGSVPA